MNGELWTFPEESREPQEVPRWLKQCAAAVASLIVIGGLAWLETQRADLLLREQLVLEENLEGEIYKVRFLTPLITARHLDVMNEVRGLKVVEFGSKRSIEGGLGVLAQHPSVRKVDVGNLRWIQDQDFDAFASLPAIEEVILDGTPVTSERLRRLLAASSLRRLWLRTCSGVTKEAFYFLIAAPQLEFVNLERTGVPPDELLRLRQARRDLTLVISEHEVSRIPWEGLETEDDVNEYIAFHRFPQDWNTGRYADPPVPRQLQSEVPWVSLRGSAAAEHLSRLLEVHPIVTHLSLSRMRIGPDTFATIPNSVVELRLSDLEAGSSLDGIEQLASLQKLSLDLASNAPQSLRVLHKLPDLRVVTLHGIHGETTDEHLHHLSGLPALETLELIAIGVTDQVAETLLNFPRLKALILYGEDLSQEMRNRIREHYPDAMIVD